MPYQENNIAAACAEHESMKHDKADEFYQEVDFQMGIEKMRISYHPGNWVMDWSCDPVYDLAIIYEQVALNFNETETIGKIVKTIFENKLREVSEIILNHEY